MRGILHKCVLIRATDQVSVLRETQHQVATFLSTPGVTGICEQEPRRTTPRFYRFQETDNNPSEVCFYSVLEKATSGT